MRRYAKLGTALLMIIILGMPGIVWIHYEIMQQYVQHQMREKLEHQELQTVQLPVAEIIWHKKNKEIIVDGKLFDIKEIIISKGIAICTGLYDEKETSIKHRVYKLHKEQSEDNGYSAKMFGKLVSLLLEKNNTTEFFIYISSINSRSYNLFPAEHCLMPDLSIPFPPPKM